MSTPKIHQLEQQLASGTLNLVQEREVKRRIAQYRRLYLKRHEDDHASAEEINELRRRVKLSTKRGLSCLQTAVANTELLLEKLDEYFAANPPEAAHAPACASDAAPEGESLPGQGEVDEAELARLIHS